MADYYIERYSELEVVDEPKAFVCFAWPAEMITPHAAVMVECWDHKRYGRVKRAYLKEFTDAERAALGKLHTRAWRWIMQRGTPDRVIMSARNYTLLTRAASFFATN